MFVVPLLLENHSLLNCSAIGLRHTPSRMLASSSLKRMMSWQRNLQLGWCSARSSLTLPRCEPERMISPNWFIDGSCRHPSSALSRYSGYAIILDLCESDQERVILANQYHYISESPPSFVVAAMARTNFGQDILRAQVSALVYLLITFPRIVHSASQVAIIAIYYLFSSALILHYLHPWNISTSSTAGRCNVFSWNCQGVTERLMLRTSIYI